MMISPEGYKEHFLKGKTKNQIMTTIRGLKRELGHLKNSIEGPDFLLTVVSPSEETRIYCVRQYLIMAKSSYVETGGTYILSNVEAKAESFDANIEFIQKITLSNGGFFEGHNTCVAEIPHGLESHISITRSNQHYDLLNHQSENPLTKEVFISKFSELHIGEWRRSYSTKRFGYIECDGVQWELKVEYNNGHKPVFFEGDNSFPYNFDKLEMLLGVNDSGMCEYE